MSLFRIQFPLLHVGNLLVLAASNSFQLPTVHFTLFSANFYKFQVSFWPCHLQLSYKFQLSYNIDITSHEVMEVKQCYKLT